MVGLALDFARCFALCACVCAFGVNVCRRVYVHVWVGGCGGTCVCLHVCLVYHGSSHLHLTPFHFWPILLLGGGRICLPCTSSTSPGHHPLRHQAVQRPPVRRPPPPGVQDHRLRLRRPLRHAAEPPPLPTALLPLPPCHTASPDCFLGEDHGQLRSCLLPPPHIQRSPMSNKQLPSSVGGNLFGGFASL